jgi:hypothetical protein
VASYSALKIGDTHRERQQPPGQGPAEKARKLPRHTHHATHTMPPAALDATCPLLALLRFRTSSLVRCRRAPCGPEAVRDVFVYS